MAHLSPPFHDVDGVPNFRDIGPQLISSADEGTCRRRVRPGIVFRSCEPSKVTPRGRATLKRLGIRRVYDLRSVHEVQRAASAAAPRRSPRLRTARAVAASTVPGRARRIAGWHGAQRVFAPVFANQDYSPEAIALRFQLYGSEKAEGFPEAYKRILQAGSAQDNPHAPFPTILRHLASSRPAPSASSASSSASDSEPPAPILIHCTGGKDRTGVICAVILSLCGVDDEAVAREYALTEEGLKPRRDEVVRRLLLKSPLKGDLAAVERMISSRKENMLATLALLRKEYGSVESFVRDRCGLTQEEVEQIRRNLIMET